MKVACVRYRTMISEAYQLAAAYIYTVLDGYHEQTFELLCHIGSDNQFGSEKILVVETLYS